MNRSRTTTDHDEIRRWAEERGGKPAAVKGTSRGEDDVGMIRIDFPGYSGEGKLEPISWEEWFQKFDESRLAMILQDETAKGQQSNFNKLVSRESVEPDDAGKSERAGKPARRGAAAAARGGASHAKSGATGRRAASGAKSGARSAKGGAKSGARSAKGGAKPRAQRRTKPGK